MENYYFVSDCMKVSIDFLMVLMKLGCRRTNRVFLCASNYVFLKFGIRLTTLFEGFSKIIWNSQIINSKLNLYSQICSLYLSKFVYYTNPLKFTSTVEDQRNHIIKNSNLILHKKF